MKPMTKLIAEEQLREIERGYMGAHPRVQEMIATIRCLRKVNAQAIRVLSEIHRYINLPWSDINHITVNFRHKEVIGEALCKLDEADDEQANGEAEEYCSCSRKKEVSDDSQI